MSVRAMCAEVLKKKTCYCEMEPSKSKEKKWNVPEAHTSNV